MKLEELPGRVFLDTSAVNFILDHGEEIHDGAAPPAGFPDRVVRDVDALYNVFLTGQRAQWQLAVSPHTYQEVVRTQNAHRRRQLETWFLEIWQYWRDIIDKNDDLPSFIEAENLRLQLLASGTLDAIPDAADRILLSDAVVYRCELFCTRDWTTILKHRPALTDLPVEIVTPAEWWQRVRPYAGLFV